MKLTAATRNGGSYLAFIIVFLFVYPKCNALKDLYDRFYLTLNDSIPCFRLTNADSQIGCSASDTSTRGVVHYVSTQDSVEWLLHHSSHPPYIALMEPEVFSSSNVPRLRDSSRVNGILLRYDNDTYIPDDVPFFSAERKCPNKDFGSDDNCEKSWNMYTNGTSLSFSDFGDFPIFAVPEHTFSKVLECFNKHNANGTGGLLDYPLCSAEMVADMMAAKNTETCFRRGKLLTLLVNGVELCDPLGDKNVWGSLFNITENQLSEGAIMLTSQLDSVAFFPYLSWGANNELAGLATLMAVLETLGNLKRSGELNDTKRPILYAFFHGETWDYIGSSRMVYDMERGVFPYQQDSDKEQPPLIRLANITDYLEFTNLGLPTTIDGLPVTYYHNTTTPSSLLEQLLSVAANRSLSFIKSKRSDLPVASLQRFLRINKTFSGAILSDFDASFNNKYYGSRYDNINNLLTHQDRSLDSVAQQLADIASAVAEAVVKEAKPESGDPNALNYTANPDTIKSVLYCFLVNTNCSLFRSVLTHDKAQELQEKPLHRYISVDTTTNSETILTYQLVASLTGSRVNWQGEPSSEPISCDNCSRLADQLNKDLRVSVLSMQFNETSDMCYCVMAHVHYHTAVSPAFHMEDYSSREYSTWVESRWKVINLNIYLVTYPLQEVSLFFGGLAMMTISLFFSAQCSRKSDKIFNSIAVPHTPLHAQIPTNTAE